jgi:hypothetical protein
MRRGVLFFIVLLLAGAMGAPAQKGRAAKDKEKDKTRPPDIELLEFEVKRDGKSIVLDGRVRNISAKPMKGVILFFEFLESDNKLISRMTAEVTKTLIEPGDDFAFETQTRDVSRAVSIRVDAEDVDGRYFTVNKPGPYDIE